MADYRQAQWDFLCGRRKQAVARLRQTTQPPAGDVPSAAWSQLAAWYLELGDGDRARESAAHAVAAAHSPGIARQASLVAYLAGPREFPAPQDLSSREIAQGYALLFHKQFAAAYPVLKDLFDKASPADPAPFGTLLAWTLIETGRTKEATDLLIPNSLPNSGGENLFESVAFPRVFQLRSVVVGERGHPNVALGYRQLFLKLSGDLKQQWD